MAQLESLQRIESWMAQLATVPAQLQNVVDRELALEKPNHALVQKTLQSMAKVLTDLIKLESKRKPELASSAEPSAPREVAQTTAEASKNVDAPATQPAQEAVRTTDESARPASNSMWVKFSRSTGAGTTYQPTTDDLYGEPRPAPDVAA